MLVLLTWLQDTARRLKADVAALYLATHDPRTPLLAKLAAVAVVAYALSPLDLIPDFVPVLGYLDDLLLLPAGIALAVRLIPAGLMAEYRAKAEGLRLAKGWRGALIVAAVWIAAGSALLLWLTR
jgi:uncharacterized membrane protein YkvA (DUF1232 family)